MEGPICKAIVGFSVHHREPDYEPVPTANPKMSQQLKDMGYHEVKVKEALERSSNGYYDALVFLSTEHDPKDFSIELGGECEEVFLYRWMMSKENEPLRVRLMMKADKGKPNELDVLLNSLKHRCPALFKVRPPYPAYPQKHRLPATPRRLVDPEVLREEAQEEGGRSPRRGGKVIELAAICLF
jgi:hypothetical protein